MMNIYKNTNNYLLDLLSLCLFTSTQNKNKNGMIRKTCESSFPWDIFLLFVRLFCVTCD